jgi:DNA-binding NtrC family response regulator
MSNAILIIEDEVILAKNMRLFLERAGYEVRCVETAEAGLELVETYRPDAVILDFNLPGMNGLQALERLTKQAPDARVIMVTGHGNVEMAVEAMKVGAFDFLTKPVPLAKLGLLLEKAFGETRRESALQYYHQREAKEADLEGMLGDSPPMQQLKGTIRQLLQAETHLEGREPPAVLVLGETGTGKEVVARALHFSGSRRNKPFVEINCASLPPQLLESELFGHERGAFTDARERKLGLVETAEGGTLFLDEIGDMDLALQAKLLKLLEEKSVRRLGSLREQKVNVRIVAATHRPLEMLVHEGRFRADLYFRLRVVQLNLPALRERGEDILLLARHYVKRHAERYGKPPPGFEPAAERRLLAYQWPGNVRELRNVLEQAVLLNSREVLRAQDLTLSGLLPTSGSSSGNLPSPGSAYGAPAASAFGVRGASPGGTLQEMERDALTQALESSGWNVTRAARTLGITRDTLRYRIDKYNLTPPNGFRETKL